MVKAITGVLSGSGFSVCGNNDAYIKIKAVFVCTFVLIKFLMNKRNHLKYDHDVLKLEIDKVYDA